MSKNLWMLAAILICGVMTVLTSCSDNENPVDNNSTPTSKKLTGMYAVVLDDEKGNIGANSYSKVLVAYDFNADGTGLWSELHYKDGFSEPFFAYGGEVGGQFKYTVYAKGEVSFTFERPDIALQRGAVTLLSDERIALHHSKNGKDYLGSLLDEKSANEIRTLMTQFNGGSDEQTATGHALTSAAVGDIVGSDGKAYAGTDYNKLPSGVTAVAMICYVDGNAHGLAIALDNENGAMDWWDAIDACNSRTAVAGGIWRLPSIKDWQYMFIGCGASGSYSDNPSIMSCSEMNSKLNAVHGTALENDFFYWSSTKKGADLCWGLYIDGDDAEFRDQDYGNGLHARACLEF